jgi:hypothetical protein
MAYNTYLDDKCPKCLELNKYLQWHETNKGYQCLPCYNDRKNEQTNIDKLWIKNNPPLYGGIPTGGTKN